MRKNSKVISDDEEADAFIDAIQIHNMAKDYTSELISKWQKLQQETIKEEVNDQEEGQKDDGQIDSSLNPWPCQYKLEE